MRYITAFLLAISLIIFIWYMQPVGLWAAQDDSGLKMFELKASDMLGIVYDPLIKHNSNTMSDMQNMIKTENGFANIALTALTASSVTGLTTVYNLITLPSSTLDYTFLCTTTPGGTGKAIWDRTGAALYTSAGATIETSVINTGFRMFYSGAINTFLSTGAGLYYKTDAVTYWTKKTLPGSANYFSTCDIYKNRMFGYDPTDNNIWYSSATDLLDFTVSADSGGVILIPSVEKIEWMKAMRGGLVFFAYDGIYILSGDEPLNFSIEKISSLKLYRYWSVPLFHYSESGDSYFVASSSWSNADLGLYVMDASGNIQKLVDYGGSNIATSMTMWYNRFLIFTNSVTTDVFDVKMKCWYKWYGIESVYKNYYVTRFPMNGDTAKDFAVYALPTFSSLVGSTDFSRAELYIKSNWMNLDSNANVNIIRRIEVDVIIPKNTAYTTTKLKNKGVSGRYANLLTTAVQSTAEVTLYTENQTSTFTLNASDMSAIETTGSEEPITTFFINTSSIRTTNKFKFQILTYNKLMWQSIRIYYEPKGNYKRKELY